MGRPSTGAWTVYESLRLDLSYLLRKGYLKKGCSVKDAPLFWYDKNTGDRTSSVSISTCWSLNDGERFIKLSYTYMPSDERPVSYGYRINLTEVPSNIGRGTVLYFICPVSGKRSRILYRAYDSQVFKCRSAYRNILYYDCQRTSKRERPMNCFFRLEDHIEKLEARNTGYKRKYRGKPTKTANRYSRLKAKARSKDLERWFVFDNYLEAQIKKSA